MTTTVQDIIRAELPEPFHQGWNRITGVTVTGKTITIDPSAYFFRYENPSWILCDWEGVKRDLLGVQESPDTALEQTVVDYIRAHGHSTSDPAVVLDTAWHVYRYLFRSDHLSDPAIQRMGLTERHLRILTEMGTVMALNRIEQDGAISNVGPAWMFGEAAKVVYGLETSEAEKIDELYHGGWFNESRRLEQVKAHAALGGRLVHGCQSGTEINMAGGCVAPYGANIDRFRQELGEFRTDWIGQVRACGK
ncbi:MAG TPA: hypothetical protein VGD53_15755 [Actinoallomurus sp.]|jgi:hypothetical protein